MCDIFAQASMISTAYEFNQDIGSWNVSKGEDFVSKSMESSVIINDPINSFMDCVPCVVIFIFSHICYIIHLNLIKTLAVGMCQVAQML